MSRADRAASALLATLALLATARAALAFVPGTWGWSLAAGRELDPLTAWLPWLVAAAALLPPVGARFAPLAERLGNLAADRPARLAAIALPAAAVLVLLLPDRVRFVGDALLRLRTLQVQGLIPAAWYPQALPLDLWLHHGVAAALMRTLGIDAALAGRLIGAADAALLAACALGFSRALGYRGAASLAACAIVFWGGALTLFTGYNKAFAEMGVLSAATGTLALVAARTGRGLWPLGLTVAVALLTHRSALALLPVAALAWMLARRVPGAVPAREAILAALPPLAALAFVAPRIVHIVTRIDPMHFTPEPLAGAGPLASLLGGARPADLANLLLFLVPVAPLVPVLAVVHGRGLAGRRECVVLLALALPFLLIMPWIHPGQGLFRDWDDFAATGTALALLAAWLVGETLRDSPRGPALAAALALACACPTLQWLVHHTELDRGLVRARRFVTEAPARIPFERAVTWQFLAQAEADRGAFAASADAWSEAAALLPSPNMSRQWGVAELRAGRAGRAEDVFRGMVTRDSNDVFGWSGLALAAAAREDSLGHVRATERAAALDPEGRVMRAIAAALGSAASRP